MLNPVSLVEAEVMIQNWIGSVIAAVNAGEQLAEWAADVFTPANLASGMLIRGYDANGNVAVWSQEEFDRAVALFATARDFAAFMRNKGAQAKSPLQRLQAAKRSVAPGA